MMIDMVTQCFRNPDPMANPRLLDGSLGEGVAGLKGGRFWVA